MVRLEKYNHNKVVTGSQDATKQVSKNEWNDGHNEDGMLGFTSQTATITIATGTLLATDTLTIAAAETGTSDILDTITTTNTNVEDIILLFEDAGDTITVTHAAGGAGQIHLIGGTNKVASETVPILLIRRGTDWYEFGPEVGSTVFTDNVFAIQDNADITKQMLVSLGGATTNFDTTLTFIQTADRAITFPNATTTLMGKDTTDIMINKSYDLGGTGNVFTGSTTEFNTALQADSFFFVSQNISNMATSTSAQFDSANSDGTFFLNADNISDMATSTKAQFNTALSDGTFAFIGVANAWGTVNQNISTTGKWQEGGVAISPIGLHDAWIPASAMWTTTTLPATGLTQRELGTNDIDIQTMDFTSTTADEACQFTWTIPKDWNAGTITVEFFWTATGGSAGNVVWGVQAVAFANDNPLDTAFGTIQEVTDGWIANDDLHISGATSAVTIAGTPVAGEMVQIKVLRSGSDASDTFATTAGLLGVRINYTTDQATS